MADQLAEHVKKMQAEGVPEADILAFVDQFDGVDAPVPSHGPAEARPIATGGGRGTGLDVRKSDAWAKRNAPAIGATLATTATGGGALPLILAASAGGAGGSLLRGDDPSTALTQGGIQGAIQGGSMGVAGILKAIAPPLYRAAVPKMIQDKFSTADVAGAGLKARAVLGTTQGTRAATQAGNSAARQIDDAADFVPEMSAQDIQAAFRPKYNRALISGKIDRANEIGAHVKKSMGEIGQRPLSGMGQLARKEFLEQEGKSAMTAANSNMAAVNPQLANIERKAIAKNLHTSPTMSQALKDSQAAIGLTRAAKSTENSTLVNRLSHGGVWNAAKSPAGLSGAAIGMNELANIPFAQLLRMAQLSQLGREE